MDPLWLLINRPRTVPGTHIPGKVPGGAGQLCTDRSSGLASCGSLAALHNVGDARGCCFQTVVKFKLQVLSQKHCTRF